MDPGERDISISKEGFASQSAKPSYTPGTRADLSLSLAAMPATIRVMSNIMPAAISLDDMDVGYAPVTVMRPPGTYRITIRSVGYANYEANVTVKEGGRADINGNLRKADTPFFKQWWFWTTVGVTVAGAGLATFIATRPSPPYDGGNTGWVAHPH